MRTFNQFLKICEAIYDRDQPSDVELKVGKIGKERKKTAPERRRTKAVGGGKTVPAKDYKPHPTIGKKVPKRSPAGRSQQPTRERGSAALSAKEAQKKAYLERKAKERGEKTKTASELLAKKAKAKVDPKYKPAKASGYTRAERQSITRKGEKKLRDLTLAATGKKKESELKHPITHKERARRAKAK